MNASAKPGDSGLHTLARRNDLPPRVRTLCEGLLKQTREVLDPAFDHALGEIEQALFKMAEQAGSSAEQQLHFEALRSFQHGRTLIHPRFLRSIETGIASIRSGTQGTTAASSTSKRTPLELVDSASLDEDLALREVSTRAEMRCSQQLHVFAYRYGVIAAAPPDHETLPIGPAAMAEALRVAFNGLGLGTEYRILAYKQVERVAFADLARLFERLNKWLADQRILPNFKLSYRPHGSSAAGDAGGDEAAKTEPAKGAEKPAAEEPAAKAPATAQARQGAAMPRQMPGQPAASRAESIAETPQFATLRNLLAARRRVDGDVDAPPSSAAAAPSIPRPDLQNLLGAMQRAAAQDAANGKRYDSERFRNTLAVKLRRSGAQGSAVGLGGEDRDTVELIGMLFDYVTRNISEGSQARSLVGQLHVPVLRVALSDKTFFTRRDHPARELINTIAETSERWLDDADADPELASKMRMVVDQLSNSYDGDVNLFTNMANDLDQHIKLMTRRADAAERRHVEAAKGRDRLLLARETARAAITGLLKGRSPSPRLRNLLENTWTDALALSALRGGSDSSEFAECLDIAADLMARGMKPLADTPGDKKLRKAATEHLRAVGLHEDEINGLLDNLFEQAPTDAALSQLERIDEALRAKPRLGGEAPRHTEKPKQPLTPDEQKMLNQIMQTSFGTWFEFTKNQQGEMVKRKLAWFSPMTGNCLFVNQRGARIEDLTLDLLAREMASGRARIAVVEKTRFVDRAWKTIVSLLRPQASALPVGEATA